MLRLRRRGGRGEENLNGKMVIVGDGRENFHIQEHVVR
jgi:hypothetical protein